ncbi:MAG: hypothetical protein M1820_006755 [Bogoriella megaspora]|nr:MAG: hypothetical protein M1820_006755 [Bogoriella megaspora]
MPSRCDRCTKLMKECVCIGGQRNTSTVVTPGSNELRPRPVNTATSRFQGSSSAQVPPNVQTGVNRPLSNVPPGGNGAGDPSTGVPPQPEPQRTGSGGQAVPGARSGSGSRSGSGNQAPQGDQPGLQRPASGSSKKSDQGKKPTTTPISEPGVTIPSGTPRRTGSSASESSTSEVPAEPRKPSQKAVGKKTMPSQDSSASRVSAPPAQVTPQREETPRELQVMVKYFILDPRPLNQERIQAWNSVSRFHKSDTEQYLTHRKEPEPYSSLEDFLVELIERPDVADAITTLRWSTELKTSNEAYPHVFGSHGMRDAPLDHTGNNPTILQKIAELGLEYQERWEVKYEEGRGPAQMALALILAKNVEVVDIRYPKVEEARDLFVGTQFNIGPPFDLIVPGLITTPEGSMPQVNEFKYLQHLSVNFREVGPDQFWNIFGLPRLKSFRVEEFIHPGESNYWNKNSATLIKSSPIENLYLKDAKMTGGLLEQMFKSVKTLRTFSYRGSKVDPAEDTQRIGVPGFLNTLIDFHGATLEDLVLEPQGPADDTGTVQVGQLLKFPRLRRVALDYSIIVPGASTSSKSSTKSTSSSTKSTSSSTKSTSSSTTSSNIIQLPKDLPTAIQALCLITRSLGAIPAKDTDWFYKQVKNLKDSTPSSKGYWKDFRRLIVAGHLPNRQKCEELLKGNKYGIQIFEKYSRTANVQGKCHFLQCFLAVVSILLQRIIS